MVSKFRPYVKITFRQIKDLFVYERQNLKAFRGILEKNIFMTLD